MILTTSTRSGSGQKSKKYEKFTAHETNLDTLIWYTNNNEISLRFIVVICMYIFKVAHRKALMSYLLEVLWIFEENHFI